MKVLLILLTFACAFTFSAAEAQKAGDTPHITQKFKTGRQGNLLVETSGGNISVEQGKENEVMVEMYVRSGGDYLSGNAAEKVLERFDINISAQGGNVEAVAKRKPGSWGWNSPSISFVVYTPYDYACILQTSGGSISISGVRGAQKVKTSGGRIHIEEVVGDMQAQTSGGSIDIKNYQGKINASTSGGSIKVENGDGTFNLKTSGGQIRLDGVNGAIDAQTSGGSINARVELLESYLTLRTSGGSISASVPQDMGMDIDLKGNNVKCKLNNFQGVTERSRIQGSVNGGGIPVKMSTSGGSVNLDYN
ncbi:MAG: DUF4097 family beta strand repeat protein [Cyclobacteriaceae bacterium]|nr:DUF4097 family beta strand repeat protein [Cyclobacteriaceae bacterium]